MAQVQIQQITRISPCKLTNGDYVYEEEIIVGADALRYRNGKKKNSCVMGLETQAGTDNQVVIGKYNATSTDALFVIGSGTSTSSKKNIVEVKNNKVIINGDLSVSNNLTVKSATISETLTVKDIVANGVIKGTMKNSSGVNYATTVELANINSNFNNYYTKTDINGTFVTISTFNSLKVRVDQVELTANNLATRTAGLITDVDNLQKNKLDITPISIEMYGNTTDTKTPFIDFHYSNNQTDYTSRIIELDAGTLSINGTKFYNQNTRNEAYNWMRTGAIKGDDNYLTIWGDVQFDGNIYCCGLPSNTNVGTALTINSEYKIFKNTKISSRRFKHDIKLLENEDLDAKKLYNVKVIQFKYNENILSKEDNRYLLDLPGFEAENIFKEYPIACDLEMNEENELVPQTWNERYIIPPMLKLIQEQHEDIENLKEEIQKLKGNS